MRFPLVVALCLLAACSRTPAPAVDTASDRVGSDATGAASDAAPPGSGNGADDATLRRFLEAKGEDIEACFAGLPRLEREPATADFRKGDGLPGADAGRVVLAIDASGSMAGKAGGTTKMQAAKAAAGTFLGELPPGVSVGLVAFGHRGSNREADKPASCAAVDTVYPLGAVDRGRIDAALRGFDATGWTPLAAAIQQAGRALGPGDGGAQAIYVVSDGEDTCGGDPVAAARALHAGGAKAIINIIGFDLAAADRAQLKAVADAGGGTFVEVSAQKGASLADELRRSNHNFAERQRASNTTFARRQGNSNNTFKANQRLSNCVMARAQRESNAAYTWAQDQGLAKEGRDRTLRAAVEARHAAYKARVAAYTQVSNAARDTVNAQLQSAQDRIDRQAEAYR